jgi:hypothetical protein
VDAQCIAFADAGEVVVQGTTGHEEIFRVYLEETHSGLVFLNVGEMFGFESESRPMWQLPAIG